MLQRLFPRQADDRFEGLRPALWLFGPALSLLPARRERRRSPTMEEAR